jgi:hypothetical protein
VLDHLVDGFHERVIQVVVPTGFSQQAQLVQLGLRLGRRFLGLLDRAQFFGRRLFPRSRLVLLLPEQFSQLGGGAFQGRSGLGRLLTVLVVR